jgi:hypothetical protein
LRRRRREEIGKRKMRRMMGKREDIGDCNAILVTLNSLRKGENAILLLRGLFEEDAYQ